MKSVNAKICVLIAVFGVILSFSSCSKKSDPGPGTVKFSATSATYAEDQGTVNIEVKLSAKQSADVTVAFTWTGSADTYLNGDFSITSSTPITIPAGQLGAQIQLSVIDDTQIDADDNLTLTLSAVTGHAKLSTVASDLNFDLTITNNDTTPADGMQIDLVWDQGLGSDINLVDLDLWLQIGVDLAQQNIGTHYHASENTSGFESITLLSTDTQQDYYFGVPYYVGVGAVNYTITLNGFSHSADASPVQTFAAADAPVGQNVNVRFFGPFPFNGTTFGRALSGNSGAPMKFFHVTVPGLQKK